jgi:hypothetical protein
MEGGLPSQGTEALRSHPRDREAPWEAEKQRLHAKIGELALEVDVSKKWFFTDLRGNEVGSGLPGILCLSRTQTWEARCLWLRLWPVWAGGKGAV